MLFRSVGNCSQPCVKLPGSIYIEGGRKRERVKDRKKKGESQIEMWTPSSFSSVLSGTVVSGFTPSHILTQSHSDQNSESVSLSLTRIIVCFWSSCIAQYISLTFSLIHLKSLMLTLLSTTPSVSFSQIHNTHSINPLLSLSFSHALFSSPTHSNIHTHTYTHTHINTHALN